MAALQKEFNTQPKIKSGEIWKEYNNQLESAIKQTDRWKNLKKEDISDEDIRKTFNEDVPMRIFAWNKKRYIDTTMTPLDSLRYHKQILQTGFLAVDPFTGEVKAWVGGVDFKTFKYDHVNVNTKRQVGSTIGSRTYRRAAGEGHRERALRDGQARRRHITVHVAHTDGLGPGEGQRRIFIYRLGPRHDVYGRGVEWGHGGRGARGRTRSSRVRRRDGEGVGRAVSQTRYRDRRG